MVFCEKKEKNMHSESLAELEIIRKNAQGKKIVFVSGLFNILHPGHLRLLRFASECGDYLVVGVQKSPVERQHILDEKIRLENIQAAVWVGHAFLLNDLPEDFIAALKPDIVVKGSEFEGLYNPELEVVQEYGGKLFFSSGEMSYSLSELLSSESEQLALAFLQDKEFMQRHNFDFASLQKTVRAFSDLRVLVLGEIIVDEYITCDPLGMSREEPCLVVSPVTTKRFLGGAGIVASHAQAMGAEVKFFSVVGSDEGGKFAEQTLQKYGVRSFLFQDSSRPTIVKQRYRCQDKSLLRVNRLRQHPLSRTLQKEVFKQLEKQIDDVDLVVFSDFNYGILPSSLVDKIIEHCRLSGVMMVADSQSSSQVGDVSRFHDMQLLTPTEREARLALRDFESGLVVLAENLRQKAAAKNVIVTLGNEGILIQEGAGAEWVTDRLRAMCGSPIDPAGAGDSFLIASALTLAAGGTIWQSAYLGSLAAACQVGRVGNIPVSQQELVRNFNESFVACSR